MSLESVIIGNNSAKEKREITRLQFVEQVLGQILYTEYSLGGYLIWKQNAFRFKLIGLRYWGDSPPDALPPAPNGSPPCWRAQTFNMVLPRPCMFSPSLPCSPCASQPRCQRLLTLASARRGPDGRLPGDQEFRGRQALYRPARRPGAVLALVTAVSSTPCRPNAARRW